MQGVNNALVAIGGGDTEPKPRLFQLRQRIRQLIHRGYLEQDIAAYSALKLTGAARPLLRGEERLELARPRLKGKAGRRRRDPALDSPADEALFERLRLLRKRLADSQGVPPYVVFGDATLSQMARDRPLDDDELLAVNAQRILIYYTIGW